MMKICQNFRKTEQADSFIFFPLSSEICHISSRPVRPQIICLHFLIILTNLSLKSIKSTERNISSNLFVLFCEPIRYPFPRPSTLFRKQKFSIGFVNWEKTPGGRIIYLIYRDNRLCVNIRFRYSANFSHRHFNAHLGSSL